MRHSNTPTEGNVKQSLLTPSGEPATAAADDAAIVHKCVFLYFDAQRSPPLPFPDTILDEQLSQHDWSAAVTRIAGDYRTHFRTGAALIVLGAVIFLTVHAICIAMIVSSTGSGAIVALVLSDFIVLAAIGGGCVAWSSKAESRLRRIEAENERTFNPVGLHASPLGTHGMILARTNAASNGETAR